MGPPGAGKGTQGIRLGDREKIPHIASGDILRRILAAEDSELARVARVIEQGKLIPDATANAVVLGELEKPEAAQGFVLDGYPRNVSQAEALEHFLQARGSALDAVIALQASEDVLVARLVGRLTCPRCGESFHLKSAPPRVAGICDRCGHRLEVREDDHPDPIRFRISLYHQKTEPLLMFYQVRGLLRLVDASGGEDAVFAAILQCLRS